LIQVFIIATLIYKTLFDDQKKSGTRPDL